MGVGGREWQTETGKLNNNVVSSCVLMSSTQGHSGIQMGRKKKLREKDIKYQQHQQPHHQQHQQ